MLYIWSTTSEYKAFHRVIDVPSVTPLTVQWLTFTLVARISFIFKNITNYKIKEKLSH